MRAVKGHFRPPSEKSEEGVGWSCLCARATRGLCKRGRGAARPSFLLAEAARSECAPSMRAVKDTLAAPLRAKWGNSEGPRLGYWHVSACQWVGRVRKVRAVEPRPSSFLGMTKKENMREVL